MRNGLSNLAATSAVALLVTSYGEQLCPQPLGSSTVRLSAGWAMSLLSTGKLADSAGKELDLGIGKWSRSQVRFDGSVAVKKCDETDPAKKKKKHKDIKGHENHIHLGLSFAAN